MSIFRVQPGGTLAEYKRMVHRDKMDCFLESCDENGRAVFSRILECTDEQGHVAPLGAHRFLAVSIDLSGNHVTFCFGRSHDSETYGQSVCLPLRDARCIAKAEAAITERAIQCLEAQALNTGLFARIGRTNPPKTLKYQIEQMPTDGEVGSILAWSEAANGCYSGVRAEVTRGRGGFPLSRE